MSGIGEVIGEANTLFEAGTLSCSKETLNALNESELCTPQDDVRMLEFECYRIFRRSFVTVRPRCRRFPATFNRIDFSGDELDE